MGHKIGKLPQKSEELAALQIARETASMQKADTLNFKTSNEHLI